LLFDVRATTAGGAPIEDNSTTLAAVSIPAANVPLTRGFFSVDVSAFGIAVTPGDILAIVLLQPAGAFDDDYFWFADEANYPRGIFYFLNVALLPFPGWLPDIMHDAGFRTFVTVPGGTVPAPSALVLVGMGIGALADVTWRRYCRR